MLDKYLTLEPHNSLHMYFGKGKQSKTKISNQRNRFKFPRIS